MGLCKIEITRAHDVGRSQHPIAVSAGNAAPVQIEDGETKGFFADPAKGTIVVRAEQNGNSLAETDVTLSPSSIISLRITSNSTGMLARIFGGAGCTIVETGRDLMESAKRPIRHQMWFGKADSPEVFYAFMGENEEYYSEVNEEAEGTPDHVALSEFAASQGQSWYDHDFMECAVALDESVDFEHRFAASWVDKWAPLVRANTPEAVWRDANVMVLVSIDQAPGREPYRQFRRPQDVSRHDLSLTYVGEVEHPAL